MSSLPWQTRVLDGLAWPVALVAVLTEAVVWRGAIALGRLLSRRLRLAALAHQLGRLPAACAVPLFLLPEGASRLGTLWAALLLVEGRFRAAAGVYALSKLFASVLAIWIYRACEPALLRVRWLAAGRRWLLGLRDWAVSRMMGVIPPGLAGGRFATRRAHVACALARFAGRGA